MVAKSSGPFGTKRSQVQILSPRPKICLKIIIFRLFCCLVLLYFLSEIPYSLSKSGFQRTSPLSASIGWQPIKVDWWNCASGFGELFGQGCSLAEVGGKGQAVPEAISKSNRLGIGKSSGWQVLPDALKAHLRANSWPEQSLFSHNAYSTTLACRSKYPKNMRFSQSTCPLRGAYQEFFAL